MAGLAEQAADVAGVAADELVADAEEGGDGYERAWRKIMEENPYSRYPVMRGSDRDVVGIMQINQHVWRGFYDVEKLRAVAETDRGWSEDVWSSLAEARAAFEAE